MQIKIFNSRKLNETREFNLELATSNLKGECFIGRSPASSLVLDSADVSRLHGKFFQENSIYYFIDIGSRNGSIINGKLAEINQKYRIKPGDIVRIGEFVLILEEMDVIRQDLAEAVFGIGNTNATAINKFADNLTSAAIASLDEISIPTAEMSESPLVTTTTEDRNDLLTAISVENTFIQADVSAIATEEETFIQISESLTDTTFTQPPVINLNTDSNEETALFAAPQLAEVEIFTCSDALTEAEKTAIGDCPTQIEVFDEILQFSAPDLSNLSVCEEDRLPTGNNREVDPILELDPWQDVGLESEIAQAIIQDLAVVEEKARATNTASPITDGKYIALMAHDRLKPELAEFVARHQAFFSQHLTIATPATSVTLQQTGLEITAETPALPIGGYQAIANLVNSGNILAVILLQDVLELPLLEQENQAALMRSCHLNQVLLATNLATAEAILSYLQSGNG